MQEKPNCIMLIDDDAHTNYMSTLLLKEAECTHHIRFIESGIKALNYFEKIGSGA